MKAGLCIALVLLAGCAGSESASRWVDETLYGTAKGPQQVAYAGVDRIKVYGEPDASSPVQGVLTLHDRVTRYQSESGFAYVEAERHIAGWVREQQLVSTLPRAHQPATPTPPSATESTEQPAPEEAPPPALDPEPVEPEPSVFDPY